jgi:hypothetical protein
MCLCDSKRLSSGEIAPSVSFHHRDDAASNVDAVQRAMGAALCGKRKTKGGGGSFASNESENPFEINFTRKASYE